MEDQKNSLKIVKNVKVKVSKNGKWLTHILPEYGAMLTFSMNYYRSILQKQDEVIESGLIAVETKKE